MTEIRNTEVQDEDDREQSRRLSLQGNRPPSEIDGYSFVRRLGTGAYGSVWLAREDRTGRMVAVKFYPHRRGLNWSMLSREVEKLAAVYTSRNIVRLLDVGWNSEPPYFVMEYVENGSLGSFLSRGPIPADEAVRIIREICSALIDAHGAGVLHCDLKPDNVLLDQQLHARICDFGQARMSHEQSPSLGTLYYMAPEQADLDALPDAKWDVYAVGAMLYHMLTGNPPHRSDEVQKKLESASSLEERLKTYQQVIRNVGTPTGHRGVRGVDSRLADLLERCLAVSPMDRLPNAQAIRDELDARDRQRARRPLLILGVLAPLLLMAGMIPIFLNAINRNLEMAKREITQRAMESDALPARLQAAALEDELRDRLEELEEILRVPDVKSALEQALQRDSDQLVLEMIVWADKDFARRPVWMQVLDAAWERAFAENRQRELGLDTSWFLTDSNGVQIWRRELSEKSLGDNFSYRDYFHGRGFDYPEEYFPSDLPPLQKPHVSVAYKSTSTAHQTVAMSVPVRNAEGRVLGVFARTANLGLLQSRLRRRVVETSGEGVERVIALAERRNSGELRLLDHPYLTERVIHDAEANAIDDVLFQSLRLDDITSARVENVIDELSAPDAASRSMEIMLDDYKDPVGNLADESAARFRGTWIAAMSPVRETGWWVIVQERKDAALRPVQAMADRAIQQAWLAVLTALLMMGSVWFFVWRALVPSSVGLSRTKRAESGHSPQK